MCQFSFHLSVLYLMVFKQAEIKISSLGIKAIWDQMSVVSVIKTGGGGGHNLSSKL